jgi:hypothetical protein
MASSVEPWLQTKSLPVLAADPLPWRSDPGHGRTHLAELLLEERVQCMCDTPSINVAAIVLQHYLTRYLQALNEI